MLIRLLLMSLLSFAAGAAAADESALDVPHLSVIVGEIGINDNLDGPQWYGIEFRGHPKTSWKLIQGFGVNWAANGAYYVFLDNRRNFWFRDRWLVSFFSGAGVFKRSRELDLGHTLEFRTGFEFAYRYENGSRLGLAFAHLSNASISDRNPGTELLVVSYTRPF